MAQFIRLMGEVRSVYSSLVAHNAISVMGFEAKVELLVFKFNAHFTWQM